ncbi:hypothetical protein IAT40_006591 [Kwoniella sp. CBS 6097]
MRVGLPFDIPYKVESEVATSRILRETLSIPSPRVLAYDPTNDNPLRFLWMLMEFVPGECAGGKEWRHISMTKKRRLVTQLTHLHSRLFNYHFDMIVTLTVRSEAEALAKPDHITDKVCFGSTEPMTLLSALLIGASTLLFVLCLPKVLLLLASTMLWSKINKHYRVTPPDTVVRPGPCSSLDSFATSSSTSRGPFSTASDWIYARLYDARARWISVLRPDAPENVWERQQSMLRFTTRLINCVPALFEN